MALNNEFKVKDNLNTLGKILSSGVDLATIFAPSNTSWTLSADVGTNFDISGGEVLTLSGDKGIVVRSIGDTEVVVISGTNATTTERGVASFDSGDFGVVDGKVSVKTGGIDNVQLAGSISNDKLLTITQEGLVGNSATTATSAYEYNTLVVRNSGHGGVDLGPTTVNGILSSNNIITAVSGNSTNWTETYSLVTSNSGLWGSLGTITETIVTDVEVGAITAAQIIPQGTTFQEFVEAMFIKTYFPTFTLPSISNVSSSIGTSVEAGTTGLTITVTFLSGNINGETVAGIWDPNVKQDSRSGILTGGQIFGTDVNSRSEYNKIAATFPAQTIIDGSNVFSVRADYEEGPQPLDSRGNFYDDPLPAGNKTSSVTVFGRRRGFWGAETGPEGAPTTSSEIRSLPTNVLNPAANASYTINIPVGATRITFAYPTGLGLANGSGSEPAFKDMTNNFDYTSEFGSPTTVAVEGANGFTTTNYYVYSYTPAVPIPGAFTLRLII
jgi:hypothetical protein